MLESNGVVENFLPTDEAGLKTGLAMLKEVSLRGDKMLSEDILEL